MKKVTISISYDEEKLSALKLYLDQKQMQVEEELTKALDALYCKNVPAGVRDYFNLRSGTPEPVQPKVKSPRQRKLHQRLQMKPQCEPPCRPVWAFLKRVGNQPASGQQEPFAPPLGRFRKGEYGLTAQGAAGSILKQEKRKGSPVRPLPGKQRTATPTAGSLQRC